MSKVIHMKWCFSFNRKTIYLYIRCR